MMRTVRWGALAALAAAMAVGGCSGVRPGSPGASATTSAMPAMPGDARILWLDATANFGRLGTPARLDSALRVIAAAGFTDIVVDVKPLSGEVLYASRHAPRLRTFDGFTRDVAWDFVGQSVREGRRLGMRVHLAANTFSEGHKSHRTGPVYTTRPEWQTTLLAPGDSLKPTTQVRASYAAFVNPARAESQAHALAILRELAATYRPDGVIIDRGRYDGIYSDFSDDSRRMFEAHIRRPVANWPADVMRRSSDPTKPVQGPLFREWLDWRASVIRGFFGRAREAVKAASPSTAFATYVGAWYPAYYEVGVNWASPDYDVAQDFAWALPSYKNHGYAPLLDFLMTGNYYVEVTPTDLAETNRRSGLDNVVTTVRDSVYNVESSIRDVARKVRGATVVHPGIYVEQYAQAGKRENYERALRAMLEMAGGVMVFDYVHLERDPGLWDVTRRALADHPRGRATAY